jgi:NAD(P)-dependent dehydrogenase (short-subunit alcohol dehydrogenase family)
METTDEEWQDELYLKVFSVLNPLRAAQPYLRASPCGRVVNICAISAKCPHPEMVATSAARACVLNLSRSLATEFAPLEILVNTGHVRRNFWSRQLA